MMIEKNKLYVIDEDAQNSINQIKKKFPITEKRSAIIESLLLIQHKNNGHVTREMMKSLANY